MRALFSVAGEKQPAVAKAFPCFLKDGNCPVRQRYTMFFPCAFILDCWNLPKRLGVQINLTPRSRRLLHRLVRL